MTSSVLAAFLLPLFISGMTDANKCTDQSHLCSDRCPDTNGSYVCTRPDGMQVEGYAYSADQRDNGRCEQICTSISSSHTCSCRLGCRLEGASQCVDCYEVYDKIVDANTSMESPCETEAMLYNIARDECVLEDCRLGVDVVASRQWVCDLKRCEDRNVQPVTAAGGVGWDIFRLNVTEPGSSRPPFPLMAVAVGAAVAAIVLTAIVFTAAVAVHIKRRRASSGREPGNRPTDDVTNPSSVNRENEPTSTCRSFDDVTALSSEDQRNQVTSRDGSIGDVTGTPDEGVYQEIDDSELYLTPTAARWSPRPHPSPAAYEHMTELASRLKRVYVNIGTDARDTHEN